MSRIFKIAPRLHRMLRFAPKLQKKLDQICVEYHQIEENFDYNLGTNGELWIIQKLAANQQLGVAFDVGANHGEWSELVAQANPGAAVHSFEICPETYQKACARLAGRKNVILNSFGLSDAPGTVKIKYDPKEDGCTTMFDMVRPFDALTIDARVERARDYCLEKGVKKIDFLKIDVEGAEHLVLQGLGDMLNPAAIPVVQFEYGMVNILTKFLLKDFYQLFESRGYKLGKLCPNFVRFKEYRLLDEDFLGPNYVAASPELARWLGGPQ